MRRWMKWFRATPRTDAPMSVEIDGIHYPNRPGARPPGGGVWRGWVGRARRALASMGPVEDRSIGSVPWSVGDPLSSASTSQDRALRMGPVFSAVRLISDTVSTLPIKAYRKIREERAPMKTLPELFRLLDDSGQLVTWLKRCVASLMLRGNAYGYITERDGYGYPTVIQWLDPSDVSCNDINPWAPIWYWQGRPIPVEDLLHIPWFVIAGKVQGLSPIEAYAVTVTTGLQAQEYGNSWFAAGGVPPGTFKNSAKEVGPTQASAISDRLTAAIRSRRPIVYGSDWDYKPLTVPPEQAQFIETLNMTATQIASIYGLPPEMIGGSTGDPLTYKTEEQFQARLNSSLRPLLVLIENAFSAILPRGQHVKLNADATARADLKTRYESYEIAQRIGLLDEDEMRALEDMPPLTTQQKAARAPQPSLPVGDPAARRWDPSQPRDGDGQWGDGPGRSTADKLKLSSRIKLDQGERLVASGRVKGGDWNDNNAVMALLDRPGGPELRFGIVPAEHTRDWRAADKGGTARLDASGVAKLRAQLGEAGGTGKWLADDYRKRVQQGEDLDWETVAVDGVIHGTGWGDVVYRVDFTEGLDDVRGTDYPDVAWGVNVAVRPADASPDWDINDAVGQDRQLRLEGKDLRRFLRQFDAVTEEFGSADA